MIDLRGQRTSVRLKNREPREYEVGACVEAGLVQVEQVHRELPAQNKERGQGDESRGSASRDPPGLPSAYASRLRLSRLSRGPTYARPAILHRRARPERAGEPVLSLPKE